MVEDGLTLVQLQIGELDLSFFDGIQKNGGCFGSIEQQAKHAVGEARAKFAPSFEQLAAKPSTWAAWSASMARFPISGGSCGEKNFSAADRIRGLVGAKRMACPKHSIEHRYPMRYRALPRTIFLEWRDTSIEVSYRPTIRNWKNGRFAFDARCFGQEAVAELLL